jgi:hypothetical protein
VCNPCNAFFAGSLAGRTTHEDLVAGFLGSVEYLNAAAKGKNNLGDWVLNAVIDELQRGPTTAELNSWEGMIQ